MPRKSDWKSHLDALPLCPPEALIGTHNLLVVAPHPDDESLGCGGLLAWATGHGRRAHVVILTDGEGSHPGSARFPPPRLADIRRGEAIEAGARLGLAEQDFSFLHLPDGSLDTLAPSQAAGVVQNLRNHIGMLAPVVVCVTASSDLHGDHRAAHALTLAATRNAGHCRLLSYPVWSWLSAEAAAPPVGWRIDITPYRETKRAAIRAHASQLGELIDDAADPFVLPAALLDCVQQSYEVLLDEPV